MTLIDDDAYKLARPALIMIKLNAEMALQGKVSPGIALQRIDDLVKKSARRAQAMIDKARGQPDENSQGL